ncbi:MAG: GNAT family N-acetyltransferase [Anaerolineales bacterium]|nr:GNAT family N-acetyltransferase [Anaerolineales bacterium]
MNIQPITLLGRIVRLDPLMEDHVPGFCAVGLDKHIWRYMRYGKVENEAEMRTWVQELLRLQAEGSDLPFAVFHLADQRMVGCTRYLHINHSDRSVEIGGTWYGIAYQRTGVNTESKYLLLQHAFESLGCIRVHFKTDTRNLRSQEALERIGAVKEGVIRSHMILPDGTVRDSALYSILASEWPEVKRQLEIKLGQR